jgi:hypothetical protein
MRVAVSEAALHRPGPSAGAGRGRCR